MTIDVVRSDAPVRTRPILEPVISPNPLLVDGRELAHEHPDFFVLAAQGVTRDEETDELKTGRLVTLFRNLTTTTNNFDPGLGFIRSIATAVIPLDRDIPIYVPSAMKWSRPYVELLKRRGYTVIFSEHSNVHTTFQESLATLRQMDLTDKTDIIVLTDRYQGPRQALMDRIAENALGCTQAVDTRADDTFRLIEDNEGWTLLRNTERIEEVKAFYKNHKYADQIAHILDFIHVMALHRGKLMALARRNFDAITKQFLINTGTDIDDFIPREARESLRYRPLTVRYSYTEDAIKATNPGFADNTLRKWLGSEEAFLAHAMNLKGIIDILLGTYYTPHKGKKRRAENIFIANGQFDIFSPFGVLERSGTSIMYVGSAKAQTSS